MTTAMEQVLNARCNRADLGKHKWPASQNTCASWVTSLNSLFVPYLIRQP
jgi:hypothetical protein